MKTLIFAGAVLAALSSASAKAQAPATAPSDVAFSGALTLASDYRFRGISQTDRGAAVQGALQADYALSDTWTAFGSVWASNLDYTDAEIEVDFTVGVTGKAGPGELTVSGIYYAYPGAAEALNYDYVELAAAYSVPAGPGSVTAGAFWSPDFFGGSGDAVYAYARGDLPVSERVSLYAEAGHQTIDQNAAYGVPDYWTWQVGAAFTHGPATFSAGLVDTDLDDAECGDDLCEAAALASVSVAF